ncbi:unnamed protein product [Cuscuta campestris]|uniref:Agenet domain-containing protein n=1 Tax=Cuscuta campestris TaxID=132261 RepID=A0A484LK91_9ASTE|nr:unnamed protein product [Cuscuta campestris]
MDSHLPFEVGQTAEAKSFKQGFRGAWFRCKIKEIKKRIGHWNALLEYYDFPDEKLTWMRLYQYPLYRVGKSKQAERQLMLRPSYPPIYSGNEVSDESSVPEVRVIIQGKWKVGDLVDWWSSGCFWSGKLTKLLANAQAQIELIPPPVGEGTTYDVFVKDLRPSLDWSPELGWNLPSPDGDAVCSCAQLIQATNIEIQHDEDEMPMDLGGHGDAHKGHDTEKESRSTSGSNTHIYEDSGNKESSDEATEVDGQPDEDLYYAKCPLKKFRTGEGERLNSTGSDTLEAAIMDLEEMRNKIKWLKQMLESGDPRSNPHNSWEFVEHFASSTHK